MRRNSPQLDTSPIRLGATIVSGGVHFGVWAPAAATVEVVIESGEDVLRSPMEAGENGVFEVTVSGIGAGTLYRYAVDGAAGTPDPRSRFQPLGVHGPSEVIDLDAFAWSDDSWGGLGRDNLSIYELHVGAYTPKGTFAALTQQLPALRELGVRAIELMPVADFPGRWNWGYDGVDLFAPSRAYGRPEDLQALVDRAHTLGLGVLLDVVYNHFGPDGNYLRSYSRDYFTDRHHTPWGEAIDYDGPRSRFVRDFVIDNAIQWVADYHFDGLRLDAADTIRDESRPNILQELQERTRASVDREIVLIAEEAINDVRTIKPVSQGGYGLDAIWADDFHHEMRVVLSNAWEGYFADFAGTMDELTKALNEGFIYQGEVSAYWGKRRGTQVTDEPATAFVITLQNHDQIGNRPFGERLHQQIDQERLLVATAVLLLAPETPLLFMGQEFAASTPFLFFSDHHDALGKRVTEGRRKEFGSFRAFSSATSQHLIPDPQAESTFRASTLRLDERTNHAAIYRYHQRLLQLRHNDPVFDRQDRSASRATPIGGNALSLHRWRDGDHRVLLANFGSELVVPVERLALGFETDARGWRLLLTSAIEEQSPGGAWGLAGSDGEMEITVPARSALLFAMEEF